MYNDNYFMNIALKEAKKAYKKNEVPIGCIIVKNNKIISKAYNKKISIKCMYGILIYCIINYNLNLLL